MNDRNQVVSSQTTPAANTSNSSSYSNTNIRRTVFYVGKSSVPVIPLPDPGSHEQFIRSQTFFYTNRFQHFNQKRLLLATRGPCSPQLKSLVDAASPRGTTEADEDMLTSTGYKNNHGPLMHAQPNPSQSTDFANRFAARPSTRPKVIGLDSQTVIPKERGCKGSARGIGGFFPPVKLRTGGDPPSTAGSSIGGGGRYKAGSPGITLELAPERAPAGGASPENWSVRTYPNGQRLASSQSTVSKASSTRSFQPPPTYPQIGGEKMNIDDMSNLPAPRMVISRDTPWVYRYKVKKNMNELSKIMASRAPPVAEYSFIH